MAADSAKQIVLLHGVVGSAKGVAPLQAALARHFDVRTPNLVGHGGRLMPDEYNVDVLAEDVLAFLDDQKLSRPHIFGYSLGGYVGLRLAQRFPDRVASIVTLATPASFAGPTVRYMRRLFNADRLDQLDEARQAELQAVHAPEKWRRVAEADERLMLDLRENPALRRPELQSIKHPVLLITGNRELIGGLDEAAFLRGHLPNVEMRVYAGKSHPISYVPFDAVAEAAAEFCAAGRVRRGRKAAAGSIWLPVQDDGSDYRVERAKATGLEAVQLAQAAYGRALGRAKSVARSLLRG